MRVEAARLRFAFCTHTEQLPHTGDQPSPGSYKASADTAYLLRPTSRLVAHGTAGLLDAG